jgi:hypothetical protein
MILPWSGLLLFECHLLTSFVLLSGLMLFPQFLLTGESTPFVRVGYDVVVVGFTCPVLRCFWLG